MSRIERRIEISNWFWRWANRSNGKRHEPRCLSGHQAGFTLVELLLVVAIMALAVSGMLSMSRPNNAGTILTATAFELAARFKEARTIAVARRSQQLVTIDTRRKTIRRGNDRRISRIAPEIGLSVVSAQSERRSAEIVGVRFFPNGSSTGATLTLFQKGLGYEIKVYWLTGRVVVTKSL